MRHRLATTVWRPPYLAEHSLSNCVHWSRPRNISDAAQYVVIVGPSDNAQHHSSHHFSETFMSKAQDSKKAVKKEPAKTMKEKKAVKKLKKEEMKRQ